MPKYFRSFIIGSSLPAFFVFFLRVASTTTNKRNYSYKLYSFLAPLYLGLMNILALKIGYYYVSLISPMIVILVARLFEVYNFTKKEWYNYYFRIMLMHFITYNIVISFLDKNV